MTEWERFQRLAALARPDSAPRVEVAARVLRTIRAMDAPQTVDLPMLIFSGVSLVAASIGVFAGDASLVAAVGLSLGHVPVDDRAAMSLSEELPPDEHPAPLPLPRGAAGG